nr:MAG TPA: hypothetical protein [Caudoviricetes sp.]
MACYKIFILRKMFNVLYLIFYNNIITRFLMFLLTSF